MFKPTKQRYRKHRKTSKDSGEQVWSDDVERIFIQGLKEYLERPLPMDKPRARSRGRNQFMVEYLESKGISRTKKQVASHVQVLRNAWRGQPDAYLLNDPELTHDDVPEEEIYDRLSNPGSPVGYLSMPGSPGGDVPDSPTSSDGGSPSPFATLDHNLEPLSGPSRSTRNRSRSLPQPQSGSALRMSPNADWTQQQAHLHPEETFRYMQASKNHDVSIIQKSPVIVDEAIYNRLCSLTLWADGIAPLALYMTPNKSNPLRPSRVIIPLKLRIPEIHNTHAPVTLHGFKGCITIANSWNMSAQCRTCVYAGETIVTEETAEMQFHISSSVGEPDRIEASLPDSPLTTCRFYLDSSNKITQHIVVDTHVLGIITYDLEGSSQSLIDDSQAHLPAVWQATDIKYFTMPVGPRPVPFSSSPPPQSHHKIDDCDEYEAHLASSSYSNLSMMSRARALSGSSPSTWQTSPELPYGSPFAV